MLQGYEDYLRHKADREVNNRGFHVIRNGQDKRIKSMAIQVYYTLLTNLEEKNIAKGSFGFVLNFVCIYDDCVFV